MTARKIMGWKGKMEEGSKTWRSGLQNKRPDLSFRYSENENYSQGNLFPSQKLSPMVRSETGSHPPDYRQTPRRPQITRNDRVRVSSLPVKPATESIRIVHSWS